MPCLIPKIFEAKKLKFLERAKGFEPSTLSLATRCSTTELRPLIIGK